MPPEPQPLTGITFQGYRRADGRVGTRNYVAVISSVNCSASVSKYIARRFDAAALREFLNVDGVVAFTYGGGCGIPYGGEYHQILTRVLGGWLGIQISADMCSWGWDARRIRLGI